MPLTVKNKKQIFHGNFLELWSTAFLGKEGKEHEWEWVKKKDIVAVFPITNDNKIVLIKNYRVPLERYVIEIPAGLLDKEGENPEDAARRELFEEAGYTAEHLFRLPSTPSAAGITNMIRHCFIATGLTKVSDVYGDVTEDITVIEIPGDELLDFYIDNPDVLFNLNILALYHVAKEKHLC